MRKRYKIRKSGVIRNIIFLAIIIIIVIIITKSFQAKDQEKTKTVAGNATNQIENTITDLNQNIENSENNVTIGKVENTAKISENPSETIRELDWNLTLVNSENKMPDNYEIQLDNIDQSRKFDSRAISYLNSMIKNMKSDGAINIWPQSTYRSVKTQEELYNNKVQYFKSIGKNEGEAKALTEQVINKPGYSEHNLGLAVDFNYVKDSFKDTKEYVWLIENAENYGFILRYPKEKESITKVSYEPWHWRFVGVEHARKINELGMCLEEYIEYLDKQISISHKSK